MHLSERLGQAVYISYFAACGMLVWCEDAWPACGALLVGTALIVARAITNGRVERCMDAQLEYLQRDYRERRGTPS
jgi:hypothetical protein